MSAQQQAMMRPNMMGPAGVDGLSAHHHAIDGPPPPHMGNGAVQGISPTAFYQGDGGGAGMPEMVQASAAAGNPMA
uniref:Uncharacterized protein n=1 Tax=Leersia perrieri TaxID=77586 RepID=A0A0D9X7K0_9ORYZ